MIYAKAKMISLTCNISRTIQGLSPNFNSNFDAFVCA